MIQDRQQATIRVPESRVVSKPIPEAQTKDPREFQLGQIRRRFAPKESRNGATTVLKFSLTPSDPDFPFEMTALECVLSVPSSYPKDSVSLRVANTDIPRGFAFNVEAGFAGLVEQYENTTLLELIKALDKNLETFLSAPKAETIKLVPNKDTRHLSAFASRSAESIVSSSKDAGLKDVSKDDGVREPPKPIIIFTAEQKAEASKRRELEIRQLEARMGRLPLYKKSSDGIAYTIPIEPKRRAQLPVALQAVKAVELFVPLLYPLQPCRIQLEGVDSEESKPVHVGFEQKAVEQVEMTMMGHINYLVQNMHILAKTEVAVKPTSTAQQPHEVAMVENKGKHVATDQEEDRSHIQYIARPPEWTMINHEDDLEYETDDVYSYDSDEDSSDEEGGVEVTEEDTKSAAEEPAQNAERGTAISFPFIELYGIELLEVSILNITVKCERCKDITEVKGLKNGISKSESCKKCASPLSVTFRKDLVHANAVRAGFLDLEGCIVGDMLPRYVYHPALLPT